jgi:hypothetical protein
VRFLLCFLLLSFSGCSTFKVFQSKVPAPILKQENQLEAERSAADLIARRIETPVELIPVAQSLSMSLGAPKLSLADMPKLTPIAASNIANADLRKGILDLQAQLSRTNAKLTALQGKEIEGTGFSLLGPGAGVFVVGLIVLGVVFPPAFTIMAIMFRRLKQTAGMVVEQIDIAAKAPETQEAVAAMKDQLAKKMDISHKKIVSSLQKL